MGILPIVSMSDLQRKTKEVLASVKDYAVIQSHGRDRGLLLSPAMGRIFVESGMLDSLIKKAKEMSKGTMDAKDHAKDLEKVIGQVLRELSKQ